VAGAPLTAAREARDRRAWREAYDLFREADEREPLDPEALEELAEAAYWTGEFEASISIRERAYALYVERGDRRGAARQALELFATHFKRMETPLVRGWLARAERLLTNEPESPEHGHLELRRAVVASTRGEFDDAIACAERAAELGRRHGDRDLEAMALHFQGSFLISSGALEEGWTLVDEATAAAVGGELAPYPTAIVYCNTIDVCHNLAEYGRAGDWTERASRWCERQAIAGFPGVCRVHRASVIRLRGAWAEAEEEARRALVEVEGFNMIAAGGAMCEIGEIRLRLGDEQGAEEAFEQAHILGFEPQPGRALLSLAQGKADTAFRGLRRTLDETNEPLGRARLLAAAVEVDLAAENLEAARADVEELEAAAGRFGSTALVAAAATARGQLALGEGKPADAIRSLRRAVQLWTEIELPYEAARARVDLGQAYRADGDDVEAELELRAAQSAFERLGARPDARRAAELLGRPAAPERAVRTFMFTDICNSTSLVQAIGDEAWHDLLRWHDETLRALFRAHGGEEVDHAGDGFFVAFPSARDAVEAATAIQRTLAEHRRTHGFAPQVRIGLHATEASRDGAAYRGRGVHEAARIGALAGEGEVLASWATLEAEGLDGAGRREVQLKGLARPVEVASVVWR
jgi:class 3 adenylate cyclase